MNSKELLLYRGNRVALVVPCYNEEETIAEVIRSFRKEMPALAIHVFDNHSIDKTSEIAKSEGANVILVSLRGKGNVVRRMFADVDADVYVMVDGDATYDPASVHQLVDKLLDDQLDMVVGCRQTSLEESDAAYRRGHKWGNRMLTESVARIFGGVFTDMLSGYRAFSRRYAKSFPALSHGFEIETELTVHALELRMPYGEILTAYGSRPEGSHSKLSTYRDGSRIGWTIARLYVSERPMAFFGICAGLFAAISVILSIPIFVEYFENGIVPRLPTAVLSAALMLMSMLSACCGFILDSVTRGRRELKRFIYLMADTGTPPKIT